MSNLVGHAASPIATLMERHRHTPGALLPALHEIQDAFGYIPREAVGQIAEALNLSRAEVHGVISFYHDFRYEPGPQVRICMGEACQAMGSSALLEAATVLAKTGVEPVYCIGNCACAPNVEIGHRYHGRVNEARLRTLLDALHDRGEAPA
ncbi:formate dehydrogenase subunit gamma [Halomonas shantousis]